MALKTHFIKSELKIAFSKVSILDHLLWSPVITTRLLSDDIREILRFYIPIKKSWNNHGGISLC